MIIHVKWNIADVKWKKAYSIVHFPFHILLLQCNIRIRVNEDESVFLMLK
jgi:hypothetical protein